jgi:hypothetical protein
MSFYHLPNPWNPGYAIPQYVMAEPPGRGTFTTKWLPRGTIPELIPDFLAKPGQKILGRGDAGLGSLGGNTLAENTLARSCFSDDTLAGDTLGAKAIEAAAQIVTAAVGAKNAQPRTPSWVLPAALVGGGALLFVLLKGKRRNPARGRRRGRRAR